MTIVLTKKCFKKKKKKLQHQNTLSKTKQSFLF